jgi:inner membrane protein
VTAIVSPPLVPLAIAGSTAPDWLEWGLNALGRRTKHRTVAHYLATWLCGLLFGLFIWDFHHALTAFCAGGLSHVIADSFTVQGVPLGWWSDRRFHLFGGRLRTGQPGEYFVTGAVVIACVALGWAMHGWQGGYVPFFYDWQEMYREGLIDASEWKANRWRWL